jgi:organic radical activating enzyme
MFKNKNASEGRDGFNRFLNRIRYLVSLDCNGNCSFCSNAKGRYELEHKGELIHTTPEIARAIFEKVGRVDTVVICGGDPSVNPQIIEVIEECQRWTNSSPIFTNGLIEIDYPVRWGDSIVLNASMWTKGGRPEWILKDKWRCNRGVAMIIDKSFDFKDFDFYTKHFNHINLTLNVGLDPMEEEYRNTVIEILKKLDELGAYNNQFVNGCKISADHSVPLCFWDNTPWQGQGQEHWGWGSNCSHDIMGGILPDGSIQYCMIDKVKANKKVQDLEDVNEFQNLLISMNLEHVAKIGLTERCKSCPAYNRACNGACYGRCLIGESM